MLWLLFACTDPDQSNTPIVTSDSGGYCASRPPVDWDGWGEGFFTTWCQACHSTTTADRSGAPEGINLDTPDDVRRLRDAIIRVVYDEATMPVGGGLAPDDLELLDILLWCGL